MKIRITDLIQDCCPEKVLIGEYDRELTARIASKVQARLGVKNARMRGVRKLPRALLLAAVLALAFGTAAFAAAEFTVSLRKLSADEELVSGFRYEEIVDGKVRNSEILVYPDAGMVFTFSCPERAAHTPEFRCFWLPREATEGHTDEEGWTSRLLCDSGDVIPYCVSAIGNIDDGTQLVLSGDVRVEKEEQLGSWELLEITSDYSKLSYPPYDRANYIMLFQKTTGYLILISGEADMETLEHIAYEMEIRESGTPRVENDGDPQVGIIDLGRG